MKMKNILMVLCFLSSGAFCQVVTGRYNECVKSNLLPGFSEELQLNENGEFTYTASTDISVSYYFKGTWKKKGEIVYFYKLDIPVRKQCKKNKVIEVTKSYDSSLNANEIKIFPYLIDQESDTISLFGATVSLNGSMYFVRDQFMIGQSVSPPVDIKISWTQEVTYTLKYKPIYNEFKIFQCYSDTSSPLMKSPPYKKLFYSNGALLSKNRKCIFKGQ